MVLSRDQNAVQNHGKRLIMNPLKGENNSNIWEPP